MNIDELCVFIFMLKEGKRHSEYLAMQSFLFMENNAHCSSIITFIQETSKDKNFNECQYIACCF